MRDLLKSSLVMLEHRVCQETSSSLLNRCRCNTKWPTSKKERPWVTLRDEDVLRPTPNQGAPALHYFLDQTFWNRERQTQPQAITYSVIQNLLIFILRKSSLSSLAWPVCSKKRVKLHNQSWTSTILGRWLRATPDAKQDAMPWLLVLSFTVVQKCQCIAGILQICCHHDLSMKRPLHFDSMPAAPQYQWHRLSTNSCSKVELLRLTKFGADKHHEPTVVPAPNMRNPSLRAPYHLLMPAEQPRRMLILPESVLLVHRPLGWLVPKLATVFSFLSP